MPQFMMMIKMREDVENPPAELYAAMGPYMEEAVATGRVKTMGGLLPSSQGARVTGSEGKIVTTHGPFAETTELVGGYAVLELDTLEEAIAESTRFIQLHVDNWPGFVGTSEIRQLADD